MTAIKAMVAMLAAASLAGTAQAQQPGTPAATVIAIPPMTTPDTGSKGNQTLGFAWQATQLIEADLRQTSEMMPIAPDGRIITPIPK